MPPVRLVLFAHGSADPSWRAPFEALHRDLVRMHGEGTVSLAYMEFAEPSLLDVGAEARHDGIERLRILPLFMAGGAHLRRDLPEQVARLGRRYPELAVDVLPPIGDDERFQEVLRRIASDACR